MSIKSKIKQLIPEKFISFYHFCLAVAAGLYFGFPSKKMIVIGVTGTKGKTSAANFIWSVLNTAGYLTGMLGTANIRIGDIELSNKYHMTMPGRFILQGLLKKMAFAGCKYCIVETNAVIAAPAKRPILIGKSNEMNMIATSVINANASTTKYFHAS